MKRLLIIAPLLGSCFQAWTVDGLYKCGGGCPEDMTCDDGVCCREDGTPACPTRVPASGRCADGSLPKSWYADGDGDSFGNAAVMRLACSRPLSEPWVDNAMDCDDTSAAAKPGGAEICDGHDNNCDGTFDEGQAPLQAYFRDTDGDGYGDASDSLMACACPTCVPPGYAGVAGDCAPIDGSRHPGAAELCNGLDDDCNNQVDDAVSVGVGASCADAGQGECSAGTTACVGGAVVCRATRLPARDICDGLDNNCNGTADEQPECGGPNQLLVAGAAVTGARDTQSAVVTQNTPTQCFGRSVGAGEGWTPLVGPWSGSSDSFHVWYAEAPAGTTWDLSKAGLKLHLQFTTQMFNFNTTNPWNLFSQPFVLVCNADPARFSRYRPSTTLLTGANITVNSDMPFAAGGGWILAQGGADLTQVKRIEVVVEPRDNGASTPAFNITFNNSTGFKP